MHCVTSTTTCELYMSPEWRVLLTEFLGLFQQKSVAGDGLRQHFRSSSFTHYEQAPDSACLRT